MKDMHYQAIIFDCDGVLVDTESISCSVLVEMAKSFGLIMDPDYALKQLSGKSPKEMIHFLEKSSGQRLPVNFEAEYRKLSYQAYKLGTKPIPGIIELLDKLKMPYCVASGGPMQKILLNLELAGLLKYFKDRIFSSYDINSWKPEPDIFLYAAKQMNFKPSECAVIEDSISGVEAATKGGFDVFLYTTETNKTYTHDTMHRFWNMEELYQWL